MEKLMEALSSLEGDSGGGSSGLSPSLEAMLQAQQPAEGSAPTLTAQQLQAMLGCDSDLAAQAEQMWKHMDHLAASDPGAYKDFLANQAKAAATQATSSSSPQQQGKKDNKKKKVPTFLFTTTQDKKKGKKGSSVEAEVVLGVYRARTSIGLNQHSDSTPVGCPVSIRELESPYKEDDPCGQLGLPKDALQGTSLSAAGLLGTHASPGGGGRGNTVLVYSLECHPADVDRALKDTNFCGLLVESACLWVEGEHKVALRREKRRLFICAGDVSEKSLQTTAAKTARDSLESSKEAGGIQGLSDSLLCELATLTQPNSQQPVNHNHSSNSAPDIEPQPVKRKVLIEEVKQAKVKAAPLPPPEYSMEVITSQDGKQAVQVVVQAPPQLTSAAAADLQVASTELVLQCGDEVGILTVALPIPVDPNSIKAKLERKRKILRIHLPSI